MSSPGTDCLSKHANVKRSDRFLEDSKTFYDKKFELDCTTEYAELNDVLTGSLKFTLNQLTRD